MGKVEAVLKSEIRRLTRREMKLVLSPLGKAVRELKRAVAQLSRAVAGEQMASETVEPAARRQPVKPERSRMSPGLIKKLRKRLALTQAHLATLIGVTGAAVVFWEGGRSAPRGESRAALVARRKLGRRQARALLEEKGRPTKQTRRKRAVRK